MSHIRVWSMVRFGCALVMVVMNGASSVRAEWPTARGNVQRTGSIDGKTGPAKPRMLWALPSRDHIIAPLVVAGDRLYVVGINVFNVATLTVLPLAGTEEPKPAWTRSAPLLKLPIVSSPAVVGGKIVFGDGMHQDSAGALYALGSDGRPLWNLRLPGELIHLEGAPTIAGSRVFIGGGAAGVLCVERDRATIDDRELDDAAIRALLDAKWKELQAKYEADKKTDPDLAVPPSEDQLPLPTPLKVWQVGEGKWHVDAPVAVVGETVLVCSAFLDKEKVGDRAVFSLNAKDGSVRWRQPTPMNPWSGVSVEGSVVVVAGSTVNMDPDALRGARGFIAAFDRETGRPLWHKDVQGGIIGSVALSEGLAIAAATDGKLRAFDLTNGERRWIYDAQSPIFAAPAVAGGIAYTGDLRGVVHAVSLKDGKVQWMFDVGATTKTPGMIYGGPVLHGGRLYVATCNLKGPHAGQPTSVVCLGE